MYVRVYACLSVCMYVCMLAYVFEQICAPVPLKWMFFCSVCLSAHLLLHMRPRDYRGPRRACLEDCLSVERHTAQSCRALVSETLSRIHGSRSAKPWSRGRSTPRLSPGCVGQKGFFCRFLRRTSKCMYICLYICVCIYNLHLSKISAYCITAYCITTRDREIFGKSEARDPCCRTPSGCHSSPCAHTPGFCLACVDGISVLYC